MIKKFEELNEGTDQRIYKISRLLSNYFYPNVSKNTYPIRCDGFKEEQEEDYEVYFSVWNDDTNDYKSGPITTLFVPKKLIK